jgi:hypothetical protein
MNVNQVKFGFLITDGEIYDTKIQGYELKKKVMGNNIIYQMMPTTYKRLYTYEPLLSVYDVEEVFKILEFNKGLKRARKKESVLKTNKLHYMSNMSVIYNYPPTYLTQRNFSLYKICQSLKKRLD